ncbi:MAG: amidohydrolase [Synergistaceae bacterium]|jgi:amidohydrolase|nr:amidohydrolase [Synergistaceae bacterium]
MDVSQICQKYEKEVIEWRREFHMHPELSLQEAWTSNRIKEELNELGIPFETVAGTHGFVGVVEGARPGKTIALRADMDALPMLEENDAPYKSRIDGAMHACGHDAHVAMLLGAGAVLRELRASFKGKILLCFQSAEEIAAGASELIDYLESGGGVDQVIALHVWADIEAGKILLLDGPAMAGAVGMEICVKGRGGHASRPDLARDPIKPACEMVLKMASIPSNFYDVLDHSVVYFGKIQGGTMGNIFPDQATISGGCRFFRAEGKEAIVAHARRIAEGVARAWDVEIEVKTPRASLPPVVNHHQPVLRARELVSLVEGLTLDETDRPLCASDNYANFLLKYPGFYGFLGARNEDKGIVWTQHNTRFDVDETILRKGYEFMCRYALDFLE